MGRPRKKNTKWLSLMIKRWQKWSAKRRQSLETSTRSETHSLTAVATQENDLMFVQRQPEVAEAIKAGQAPPPPPSTWDKPYGGTTGVSMGVIASLEIIEDDIAKD